MTLTHQHHHPLIFTSYTNTRRSVNNSITSSSLYTQTHDTQSATSSHDHHFIHKVMTLTQQDHHIILTAKTNTRHSLNNLITSSSFYTQTHDTQLTTSSHHPHFIHKRMTLIQQDHHIILTAKTNTRHALNNLITSSSLHTQTHDTHSTTSSNQPHFIHKRMTLIQQDHHIILISNSNT